jgi:tetratricopeptide (TPR) repeat protein
MATAAPNPDDKGKGKKEQPKGKAPEKDAEKGDAKAKNVIYPLPPAKRKRMQKAFEHASLQMKQDNFDYATALLTDCVTHDPDNAIYLQSFLGNLRKKYNNNKKGAKFALLSSAGPRSGLKKCQLQKDWEGVLRNGFELLKLNPWDSGVLCLMATACDELGYEQTELVYLRMALDADSKSPDINRQAAISLARRQMYEQAIACWHRVEQAKPGDEEAQKAIGDLTVEKTIKESGYEKAKDTRQVMVGAAKPGMEEITPEERLEKQISKKPDEIQLYYELAQLHLTAERYDEAEKVLKRAVDASNGDLDVREKWEDALLRNMRARVSVAEKKTRGSEKPEDKAEYKRARKELNAREIEVYKSRVERYPNNLTYKYELASRLQYAGDYQEAIKMFQAARNDPRRKGTCMLALGHCFEKIKKARMALRHYEEAIGDIPDRDENNKKEAIYRTGKLAMELGEKSKAEKHLNDLAQMDYDYRDVSELLDRVDKMTEGAPSIEVEE